MKRILTDIIHQQPGPNGLKVAALVIFLVTPGSMLLLPLAAWWFTRR